MRRWRNNLLKCFYIRLSDYSLSKSKYNMHIALSLCQDSAGHVQTRFKIKFILGPKLEKRNCVAADTSTNT